MTLIQTHPAHIHTTRNEPRAPHTAEPQTGTLYVAQTSTEHGPIFLLIIEVLTEQRTAAAVPVTVRTICPTVRDVLLPQKITSLNCDSYALTDMRIHIPFHRLPLHHPAGKLSDLSVSALIANASHFSKDELYARSVEAGTETGSFIAGNKGHLATQRRTLLLNLHSFAAG